jgi:DNA-binding transcriptional MerR regulator
MQHHQALSGMVGRFDDGKEADALRTIGEVSEGLGIKAHVLRYWEQQFPQLKPVKRSGGRRYYRAQDIALIETIDRLVNREGYTLKGARAALRSGSASEAASVAIDVTAPDLSHILPRLKAIRSRLAAAIGA